MKLNLTVSIGIAALAFATAANFAQAGECPSGKMKDNAVTSGEMMPKKVTDQVLASIDLTPKGEAFKGEALRLRKLVIQPGGVVPWHDVKPASWHRLAGTPSRHRGQERPSLDDLQRLRLHRSTASYQQSRCCLQDGLRSHRFYHIVGQEIG